MNRIFILLIASAVLVAFPLFSEEVSQEDANANPADEDTLVADPGLKDAVKHFEKGVGFFNEENYGAALVEFLKSYELHPNWALRYNIGICYLETGKSVKALDHFKNYLEEGKDEIPGERRSEVEEWIREIESKAGQLVLEVSEKEATVILDELNRYTTPIENSLPLMAGFHILEVKKPGFETFKSEITLASGEKKVLSIKLRPLQSPPSQAEVEGKEEKKEKEKKKPERPKRWLWAGLGAGMALGAVAAITGGLAIKKRNDMRDAADGCNATMTHNDCPDAYTYQDQARNLVIATNVLWGIAGAAAATGLILFILDKPKAVEEETPGKKKKDPGGKGAKNIVIVPGISTAGSTYVGMHALTSF